MTVAVRVVVGILLIAHGLVHLLYVAPVARDPGYPFSLDRSWLLPAALRRPVAVALLAAVVAAFLAAALAWWGVPGLAGAWSPITIVAASLSLVLLIAFWDARLWAGLAISALLLVLAALRPEWLEPYLP
jgi:hypothetical protein